MSEAITPKSIIRFTERVDEPERAQLIEAFDQAGLAVTTGWDLGYRGPEDDDVEVLATVGFLADLSKAATDTASTLGGMLSGWLRKISAPGARVSVEMIDQRSQTVVRVSGTDPELAYRLITRALAERSADAPLAWNGVAWTEEQGKTGTPGHPRAFVSYAHDSDAHKARVLEFSTLLASCGVEPRMDRFALEVRRDWYQWAQQLILDSDYVIVVASPVCRMVADGYAEPDENRGLKTEMRLLRELYHSSPEEWTQKMLPVVFPGNSVDEIPLFLQPRTADHFLITSFTPEGAEDLLRILHRRPPFSTPEVGPKPELPPHD